MDFEDRFGAIADSLPSWCQKGHAKDNSGKCKKLRSFYMKPLGSGRISKVFRRIVQTMSFVSKILYNFRGLAVYLKRQNAKYCTSICGNNKNAQETRLQLDCN